MVRKGIKPIKCVGWLNCAKRDIPKRQREGGRGRYGVRGRPRAMRKDKRELELGQKDTKERCSEKEKKGWRERLEKSRKTERRQGTKV